MNNLKKGTKVGLVTSAVYMASAFALPAFASQVTEKPVVQPVNISQITTLEQADNIYNSKLVEYAYDKKITKDEISVLYNLLERKEYIFRQSHDNQIDEGHYNIREKKDNLKDLNVKIQKTKIRILNFKEKETYNQNSFEEVKNDLEEKILCYYPSLIEKKRNITYSAYNLIGRELDHVFLNLLLRANKFLNNSYNDTSLELLLRKENYDVRDVVVFYEIIHKERPVIKFDEIAQNKLKLEKNLQKFEEDYQALKKLIEQEKKELNINLKNYEKQLDDITQTDVFKGYFLAKADADSFLERYGNLNKYIGISVWSVVGDSPSGFLRYARPEAKRRKFNSQNKLAISELKNYFKSKDFDVKVEDLKNPAQLMFPWPWWINAVLGGIFPLLRNVFTAKLIRREVDTFDVAEGIVESLFFPLFFDGAFPLLYPIRMFGLPFIVEPIRAATGWRDT